MDKALLAIVEILMKMGKTKKEAVEFVGKEMPKGGIDTIASNVIKPITKRVAGDYPLLGSRITDPTQQGQYGRYNIQVLDTKDRYSLVRQSIEDQNTNWKKTLNFLREGGYTLSKLQEQNLNYNMGVLQRSKLVIKDMTKGLESGGENVEEIYQAFVKNKRFLGNEKTGLSSEGDAILDIIDKTKGDLKKLTKGQDEILAEQKAAKDKRMKKLYEGRPYEGNVGMYRTLGGYHLPKLHEAGIINLDPKIYEALKAGRYHYGNADFFAPDPNRILRYHYGTKIFDDLDKAIEKAALNGDDIALKGPNGMIDFLKKNDYLPFKKDGPKNSLDYMETGELLERVKELDKSSEVIKKGNSPFFKTPDEIMDRVMQNANEKKLYLESFKRIHPERYKLYEKRQSEEPFFALGDVGQNDMFSDLADITKPKDKAKVIGMRPTDETLNKLVEEHAANAEKLKQIDIGDRPGKIILNYSDYTKLTDRNTQIEEIIKNARKVVDEEDLIKSPKKDYDDALFNQKAKKELQKNLNKETKDLEKVNEIEELSKDLSKESDVDKILLKSEELKKSKLTHNEKINWLVKNVDPNAEQTIPPKATLEAMLKDGREDLIDHFFEMHTKELGKPTLVKPGQGKFTKAEYLIQRLENTLKDPNADPYVKKTFPGFIKELKADPDLAKDENVFKELGGDLPEDQQIVVYDDDTLDFFTQKEGPGNIKTLDKLIEDNPFLSREEGLNLLKMEPNDQVMELTKLKFLNKKKTDNAEGGIINLAQGGRTGFRWGGPGGKSPGTSSSGGTRGGPGPGGQGARGQATQNPGRNTRSAPAPTYQNVHQTGAVTQTPGRTVTTGGNNTLKTMTSNVKPTKSLFEKYSDHAKFTENMKNYGGLKNYHQLGGYDFMNRFNANPNLAKALGYGYQGLSEGLRSLNPFDDYSFMDAMKTATHEGNLNALGVEAFSNPNSSIAKEYNTLSSSGFGPSLFNDDGTLK